MSTLLTTYRQKHDALMAEIEKGGSSSEKCLLLQELKYRVCVLETFQMFLKSAPITTDVKAMQYHYQLVAAHLKFMGNERKLGEAASDDGKKKRETAAMALANIIADRCKRFSGFRATAPESYKNEITNLINTVLLVWIQYRDTYIKI